MASAVQTGSIDRIEVENFKSYKGNQVIGPFKNFTAIIGPNGAGKSNLMDAISFVLGVRTAHLRGSQLKDLIYALNDSEKDKKGRKCHVKLVYITGDDEELQFMRTITSSGSSEYRLNERVMSWDDYNGKLKSLGILVKARNFLVFQGDLEFVASKNPKELTVHFEQISGSEDLKKEYEQLEEQKARAEEKMALNYQKRRAVAAERREKKEQKEEAEKHLQLQDELKNLKTQYFLWQLLSIDKDVESSDVELMSLKSKLEDVNKELEASSKQMREKKKTQDGITKDVVACEEKLAKKKAEVERRKPEIVKFREELKRVHDQIKRGETELDTKRKQAEKQAKEVDTLQRHLEDITAQLQGLSQQGQEGGGDKIELAASQMEEYRRIKEEAGTKTSKLTQEKKSLDSLQQSDITKLAGIESDLKELDVREDTLKKKLMESQGRYERSLRTLEEGQGELESLKLEDQAIRERHRKSRQRTDHLQSKLDDVERKLKDLKADKRESERDIKLAENVASLKRLFPGVHGQVSQICKPRDKKYNTAISIVMGRFFEAVVVDVEKTGKDCIEYLKEQRQPAMTFVPLESIRVKPIQERLRTFGGTSRLLIDVIEYEKIYETALLYAVGNTIVCDQVDEAKYLAWGSAERQKVVTTDGTLLAKGGSLTGGVSSSMEAKARRWDNQAIEALKNERDKWQQELLEVPSHRDLRTYEESTRAKLSTVERRIAYAQTDTAMSSTRLEESRRELEAISRRKESEFPRVNELRESISTRAKQIAKLENRVHEIEDRLYRNFSESVGVANIREYEENRLKQQEELASRMQQLKTTRDKLESQLKYELRRDMRGPVKRLEEQMSELLKQTRSLRDGAAEVKRLQEDANKDLNDLEDQRNEIKAKVEAVESEIQALNRESGGAVSKAGKLKRDITAMENHLESLRTRRNAVLEDCELNQIKLKTPDGDSVPMDIDSVGPVARTEPFDYSDLNPRYRQDMRPADKEKLENNFKAQMDALSAEIVRTAPNLKALEQYESLKGKEKETVEEFEAARREAKELSDRFNAVKQERYSRFMEAFNHICTGIDQIYKDLTMSATHPLGGTAYLALENEDDPFLAGIRYTAMPPTKRFRDMEQLSGGEKTVAALALLFAIHSFRPSPFFVLDEVDAALDNLNVSKVAAYIRSKSREDAKQQSRNGRGIGFQSVVISLKDQFYDKADALVGVYRAADEGCSKALTFDLSKYAE